MKTIIISAIIICGSYFHCGAQNLIAVQNPSSSTFFTNLDTAITYAQNGDTIYVPGGNFNLNTKISKRLCIIGAGHHPDSTVATNATNINGNCYVITGASYGSLIGVRLSGYFYLGSSSSDASVTNYTVGRCYIPGQVYSYSSSTVNNLFYENILVGYGTNYSNTSISLSNSPSNYFYNNIISGGATSVGTTTLYQIGAGSIFKNNIFINGSPYDYLAAVESTIFENNIFYSNQLIKINSGVNNNIFNNNLFVGSITFPFTNYNATYNNTGINNIVNQTQGTVFVNWNSNSYSYTQDYHLQSLCPGKNAGKDGTDVGIYGGTFPWKEGSVPFNPHIILQNISGTTNSNGTLPVNIKVAAQDY